MGPRAGAKGYPVDHKPAFMGRNTQAFVADGSWDSAMSHPAMPWFKSYAAAYDAGEATKNPDKWFTSDWQYANSKGQTFSGSEAIEQLKGDYQFFTKWYHQPYHVTVYETESGYELDGNAWLYLNLPGGSGDASLSDEHGNKWQMRVPGGFHFKFNKDGSSYKLAHIGITSDSGPVVLELLKRGVITPTDLGL